MSFQESLQTSKKIEDDIKKQSTMNQLLADADGNTDKDILIDEMRLKLGDLLKRNQELCSIQKENLVLKQEISTIQTDFQKERQQYSAEIEQLKNELLMQNEKVNNILAKNEKLKSINLDNKNEMRELQTHCQQMKDDLENVYKKYGNQLDELKNIISEKDGVIHNLKIKINELEMQNSVNSNAFAQQQAEFEKLGQETIGYQGKVETLEKKTKQQNKQMKHLNKSIDAKDTSILSLKKKLGKIRNENSTLKDTISQNSDAISTYKDKLDQISKLCKSTDYENLPQCISKIKHENKALRKAIKASQEALHEIQESLQQAQQDIENKQFEINNITNESKQIQNELIQKSDSLEMTIRDLNDKIVHFRKRDQVGQTLSRINQLLFERIRKMTLIIENKEETILLKPMVHAAIMLNRWKNLCGTKKEYISDGRNWWWLASSERIEQRDQIIEFLEKNISELNETKEQLKQHKEEIDLLKSKVEELSKDNALKDKSINDQNDTISSLNQEIENKVKKEDFVALYNKYVNIKNSLR